MPVYDDNLFDPPAPLARVTLRNPKNANIVSDVPMLLDSGADVTLVDSLRLSQFLAQRRKDAKFFPFAPLRLCASHLVAG